MVYIYAPVKYDGKAIFHDIRIIFIGMGLH